MMLINKKWIMEYRKLNMTIEKVLPDAFLNLENLSRNGSFSILPTIDKSQFAEVNVTADYFGQYTTKFIDICDVVNFALSIYLQLCRRDYIKNTFKQNLNKKLVIKMLENLNIDIEDQEIDEEKNRIYIYTKCPRCGTDRFYFSIDMNKQDLYVGCYNDDCIFHKPSDIVNFIMKYFNLKYPQAVEYLAKTSTINIDDRDPVSSSELRRNIETSQIKNENEAEDLKLLKEISTHYKNDEYLCYDDEYLKLILKYPDVTFEGDCNSEERDYDDKIIYLNQDYYDLITEEDE